MAPRRGSRISVRVEVRGYDRMRRFLRDTIELEMFASDKVADLKTAIRARSGVLTSEQILTTHGGVMHDSVKLGETFNFFGGKVHCFYLWLCKCSTCSLQLRGAEDEDYFPIIIENAPEPLTLMVKPNFTISFLRAYLSILLHCSTKLSYEGKVLKEKAGRSTIQDYDVQANSCVRMAGTTYSSKTFCEVVNTTTRSLEISDYLHTSTTCGDLKNFFQFALGTPCHHQKLSLQKRGEEVPVNDDHRMDGGRRYIYRCGWPDFQIQVMTVGGYLSCCVNEADSVAMVKRRIQKEEPRMACDKQRLLFHGKVLEDGETLRGNNIKEASTLTLVVEPELKRPFRWFGAR